MWHIYIDPHFHLRKRSVKESCNKPRYMWVLHGLDICGCSMDWVLHGLGASWTGCMCMGAQWTGYMCMGAQWTGYMWVLHGLGAPWTEVYVGAPWTGGTCKRFLAIAIPCCMVWAIFRPKWCANYALIMQGSCVATFYTTKWSSCSITSLQFKYLAY